MRSPSVLLVSGLLACAVGRCGTAGEAGAPGVEDLRKEVERLSALVKTLEAQAEGTAHPVNLGRTALARVSASSVNGERAMANRFYGILNAFDGGQNIVNNINYTYWFSSGEPAPWIEVRFDKPVTVTGLQVEGTPLLSARLSFAKGGEEILEPARSPADPEPAKALAPGSPVVAVRASSIIPKGPLAGVTGVKLTFAGGGNCQVNEVRVLGYLPAGVEHRECSPSVTVDDRTAELAAKEAFDEWFQGLRAHMTSGAETTATARVFTYSCQGVPVLRVEVSERGAVKTESLGAFARLPGKSAQPSH